MTCDKTWKLVWQRTESKVHNGIIHPIRKAINRRCSNYLHQYQFSMVTDVMIATRKHVSDHIGEHAEEATSINEYEQARH